MIFVSRARLASYLVFSCIYWLSIATAAAETCEEEKKRVEEAFPDTTIVCEERRPSGGSPFGGGGGGGSFGGEVAEPPSRPPGGGGGTGRPRTQSTNAVEPSAIKVKKCPGNWQQSYCTAIRFLLGSPPTFIDVGVTVGAPQELRDGKKISAREMQVDASVAATNAGNYFIGAVRSGSLLATQVPTLFPQRMGADMMSHGIGYRVQQCNPVPNSPPPC